MVYNTACSCLCTGTRTLAGSIIFCTCERERQQPRYPVQRLNGFMNYLKFPVLHDISGPAAMGTQSLSTDWRELLLLLQDNLIEGGALEAVQYN